ncbi:hypothetical protein BI364_17045 [Acidihalobacter yilgarnensis]|uniref:Uncharacterized protein n=1 Tax=Acidihalobacter yilgarnensis TaxID=2819280 RepID=A0A1D8IST5_9GAMM|nr:hypothetical protein [Acidihalobacter yilgarnensis]AOU99404.1 hypothetical protein BI364_17045 [Acidihalobacter yilgarnensis]
MRRTTLATMILLTGMAMTSAAHAAGDNLDITINVVGPNQDVQGAIENHISIPGGDHGLIRHTSGAEASSAAHESSETSAQAGGGPRQQAQESSQQVQESSQQAQQSSQQAQESSQQTQQQAQQQAQQEAQDATTQGQPDN